MEENNTAVNTPESAAIQPNVDNGIDYEGQIATLKAREAKLIEERDNYKAGMLKYKGRAKEELSPDEDEERIKAAAKEALAESQLAEVARELNDVNQKLVKENKELKLAHQNKNNDPPAVMGSHSEAAPVKDTTITPEQMDYFQKKGWNEKDIERYKRNLAKRI